LRASKKPDAAPEEIPFAILGEDGSCPEAWVDLVDDARLVRALEEMVLNRVLDRRCLMLQRQGRLGFYMTSSGEEATTIGAASCLREDDPIFLTYREIGSLLWRGVPLELLMNQLIGNSQDATLGRQMPIHFCFREWGIPSVSSPVGTQLPHACGYAWAARFRGTGQVALAYLGEGTASQGDFHTALNFSGVFGAPAVYVIRNNGYAISTPESVQTAAASLARRGDGYGIPGWQIDGNDFLAVVYAVSRAVTRARDGGGPTLIEALTYRMGAHSTADDPSAYRSEEEAARWQALDPLPRLARHARWRGLWSEEQEKDAWARCDQRVSELIDACEAWPPPALETLFADVLQEPTPQLAAQRESYLRYLRARRVTSHDVP
jgi:2-oxoisovalerate dehydrogenase E1 component alpha subunit